MLLPILRNIYGQKVNVMRKLLPLLLEWDARHASAYLSPAYKGGAVDRGVLQTAEAYGALFLPVTIAKNSRVGARQEQEGVGWR